MKTNSFVDNLIPRLREIWSGKKLKRPLQDYRFIGQKVYLQSEQLHARVTKSLTWIVPPFHAGAGGHTTIFRFVDLLTAKGFKSRIVVMDGASFGGSDAFKKLIERNFGCRNVDVFVDLSECPPSDITIATSWLTAYLVLNYQAATRKVYFVQDFEPWFYPRGTDYELAEATYSFNFFGITAGNWLSSVLSHNYGMKCSHFSFSYDENIYFPPTTTKTRSHTLFFYARPSTHRRAFELGLIVLDSIKSKLPKINIVFAGGDLSAFDIPFAHTSYGVLEPKQLAQLYRECDLALVLSHSNVSLLPLEIMACGTAVVTNSGPWVEWLLNENICLIGSRRLEVLIEEIVSLLLDDRRLEELSKSGLTYAISTSWNIEAESVSKVFEQVLREQ